MKKDFKIGEVFQFGLIKLECRERKIKCDGCHFVLCNCYGSVINESVGECHGIYRSDKKNVLFVKVEE